MLDDSPVEVRDQHYEFDFEEEPPSARTAAVGAAAALDRSKLPPLTPSPPPHPDLSPTLSSFNSPSAMAARGSVRGGGREVDELKEAAQPARAASVAGSPPLRPRESSDGVPRSSTSSSATAFSRRSPTASVVLSSAARQSISALKQRRRTRTASAIGDTPSGALRPTHSHTQSQYIVDRRAAHDSSDDDDDSGAADTQQRRRHREEEWGGQTEAGEEEEKRDDEPADKSDDTLHSAGQAAGGRLQRSHTYGRASLSRSPDPQSPQHSPHSTQAEESEDELSQHSPPRSDTLPRLHSTQPVHPSSRRFSAHPNALLHAATPSPTPSVPLLPHPVPRPRTRAASAFPSLSTHTTPPSPSVASTHAPSASHHSAAAHSTLQQPEVQYTPSELLPALDQPTHVLNSIPRLLQSTEWHVRFDALTALRSLVVHHASLLPPTALRSLLRDVRSEVDSLRSLLAKNAIIAVQDMFEQMPAKVDGELPQILPALLKRAGETSGAFLAEEADKALTAICLYSSDSRAAAALMAAGQAGNKLVRAQSLIYLARCVELRCDDMAQSADFGRICRVIGAACGEATVNCRQSAKRAVWRLVDQLGQQRVEAEMRRALTPAQLAVLSKCLERGEEKSHEDAKSVSFAAAGGGRRERSHTRGGRPSHVSSLGSSAEGSADLSTGAADSLSINGSSAFDYGRTETDPSLDRTSSLSPHTPHSSSSTSSLSSASLSSTASFSPSPCKTSILKRRSTLSSSASTASSNASSRQSTRTSASTPASSSSYAATGNEAAPSDALSAINDELSAGDWRTRLHAISALSAFVHLYPSFASSHVSTFLDALLNVIADNNGKVILAALQSLPAVLPALLPSLPLLPFLQRLCGNLSSTSPTVRSLTSQLLDDMPGWADGGGGALLAGYSGVCLYANSKIRVLMVEKLAELIARKGQPAGAKLTVKSRGLAVQQLKHAIPVAFLWCDEGRADMRSLLQKLTLLLYGSLGSEMFDAQLLLSLKLDQSSVKRIKALLNIQ